MSIRRTDIDRLSEVRKSSRPTVLKGPPSNSLGAEGDLTLRRNPEGFKLYIKGFGKWHGVKIGETFSNLEKLINNTKSKVDLMKSFKLPSTYKVTGDFTLDASGDIELNADGGQVNIMDGSDIVFVFDCDVPRFRIYDDANNADHFTIDVGAEGATLLRTVDDDTAVAHLTLDPDGQIIMTPEPSQTQGVHIDFDTIHTTNKTCSAFFVDADQTGIIASGQTLNITGIDSRVNTNSPTMVGTVNAYGIASSVSCGTSGTQTAYGLYSEVSGADTNTGLYIKTTDGGTSDIKIVSSANTADYFTMFTGADGETTIRTVEDGVSATAHLNLDPDGNIKMTPHTGVEIESGKFLFLDGGGDTYFYEQSADVLRMVVGGDVIMHVSEQGDDGNQIYISTASVGFTQLEPTYDASNTDVDFRHSNKQNLTFGSGDITNLRLFFPAMSGNFILLVKQDGTGSRTITNYKTYESDETSADGSAGVVWAGGSAPTLTTDANHVDILSFYYDADNEIAYGVATLDFQF